MNDLGQLKALFTNHRFGECIRLTNSRPIDGWGLTMLRLRSLFQLGRFQELISDLADLDPGTLHLDEQLELTLWNFGFMALLNGNPLYQLQQLQQLEIPVESVPVSPWYYRTMASLMAMAIQFYQLNAKEAGTALTLVRKAQTGFVKTHQLEEALACRLLEATMCWQLKGDVRGASVAYQQAESAVQLLNNPILLAEVWVQQAEFTIESSVGTPVTEEQIRQSFTAAEPIFNQHRHALGQASIQLTVGKLLEKRGFRGEVFLQQALMMYQSQQDLGGVAECLGSLCQSYLISGELTKGMSLSQTLIEVTHATGYPMRMANAFLTRAEYASRQGIYAQAIYYARQAQLMMNHSGIQALYGLSLSQFFLRIHQPLQAIEFCKQTVHQLQQGGDSALLSSAYFFLGTTNDALERWSEAVDAFTIGIGIDSRLGAHVNKIQQQSNRQWTLAKQAYHQEGILSPTMYQLLHEPFVEAINELQSLGAPEIDALRAQIRQFQSSLAQFAGLYKTALEFLEQAELLYQQTHRLMEAATTQASIGLTAWGLAQRGEHVFFEQALVALQRAGHYFAHQHLNEQLWRVQYNQACCWWDQAVCVPTKRQECLQQASVAFHLAADTVDYLRNQFVDASSVWQDSGKVGVIADKEVFYLKAIRFHLVILNDPLQGFYWVERFKGRTFTEMLASLTPVMFIIPGSPLLVEEQALTQRISQEANSQTYYQLTDQRRRLWQRMKTDPITQSYAQWRLGEPLTFTDLKAYLTQ